jgi:hypothetical protein
MPGCRQALRRCSRLRASRLGGTESNSSGSAPLTFELLSDDVVENKILASRMALAMGETLQPGFEAMRLRIQALEGHELASQDMFRAETICLHLVEQWLGCGMERKHLLRAVEPLQNALAPLMESEYSILHKLLDAKGVSKAQDARCACDVPRAARPPVPCIWAPAVAMAMHPMRVGPTLPCSTCRPVWLPAWAPGLGWPLPPGASAGLGMLARAPSRAGCHESAAPGAEPACGRHSRSDAWHACRSHASGVCRSGAGAAGAATLMAAELQAQYPSAAGSAMAMPAMDYSRQRSASWSIWCASARLTGSKRPRPRARRRPSRWWR